MIKYSASFMTDDIDFKGVSQRAVLYALEDIHEDVTLVVDRGIINDKSITIWSFQYMSDSKIGKGGGLSHRYFSRHIERTINKLKAEIDLSIANREKINADASFESSTKYVKAVGEVSEGDEEVE